MHRSNYSRVEAGEREVSIDAIGKIAKYFNMTIDDLVNLEDDIPQEITFEDKTIIEQMQLIQELEEDDKQPFLKLLIKCSRQRSLKTSSLKM